jgi:aldehyde dehydrogenase (NAD+)
MWHEERLLIDGELRSAEGGATYPVENPTTGGQLGEAANATPSRRGGGAVRRPTGVRRERLGQRRRAPGAHCLRQLHQALVDHADQLTELTIAEVGAPRSACATVQLTAPTEFLPYYAELAEGYEWTTPLGVADTLGGPARAVDRAQPHRGGRRHHAVERAPTRSTWPRSPLPWPQAAPSC